MGDRCGTAKHIKSRAMAEDKRENQQDQLTLEVSLNTLYELQRVDSRIAQIRMLRGELPEAVQDLEDEIAGLQTRVTKLQEALAEGNAHITTLRHEIKSAEVFIKKYEGQLENVRNNREYDSLIKETELRQLDVDICNKDIREQKAKNEELNRAIESTRQAMAERELDLSAKRTELSAVIAETGKEEEELLRESEKLQSQLPERLLQAYTRICASVRNGLGVVTVVRDACGGCFRRIPPQRQIDIRSRKRIVVCENCGRILVDDPSQGAEEANAEAAEAKPVVRRRRRVEM